ncbi:Rha family transcriptional regulator [Enterococcus raffinosus]|uniref:Rha family transcriptional regulator n=1 Tax=Enterococcus raffinosus TaxID=71452 RepID=UPI00288CADC2|nr:Rha family transcriptional regulator [Enterococcus raffinosus]MDT2554751.1 Rha family transcriptional regulator [Enterococcus raffinosus]
MNQLTQTLTSNEVAEMIGKDHSKLIRDIRTYIGYLGEAKIGSSDFFIESTYKSEQNKDLPNYLLTKQGCEMVSNKLTGPKGVQFTAKYVNRFNQMEEHIKQQVKIPTTPRDLALLALSAGEETNQRVDELDTRVADLEENTVLSAGDYGYISRRINQRVSEVARGFGKLTQEQRGKLHKDINSGVKAVTGVSTRTQLRNRHYETVLDFINDWEPSTATKMQVRQMSF